jgi:outer membrane lipoprotein-sorting protein
MELTERALRTTQQVADYTATLAVTVEAPNVKIPRRTVQVFYKQPDRIHVESDGLVLIPRDALLMGNLATHLKEFATAAYAGEGTIGGRTVRCVKLTPRDAGPGSGRMLLWIDPERALLLKSEIWRGGTCQLTSRFHHRLYAGHWMPRQINTYVAKKALGKLDGPARIELDFLSYRINRGISDDVFESGS